MSGPSAAGRGGTPAAGGGPGAQPRAGAPARTPRVPVLRPPPERRPLAAVLTDNPALLVQVPVAGLLLWLAAEDAGTPLRRWGGVALLVLGLLLVAAIGLPRPRRPSRPVLVALAAFAGFTAWSGLSVGWASVPGEAWAGANRTALYLLLLVLAALWPPTGRAGLAVLGLLLAGLGLGGVLLLAGLGPADFLGTRLLGPTGYPNALAALALLAAWPAIVLASRPVVPWGARGGLAALAVLGLGIALLTESRGALAATPIVAVTLLVLLPGRVRLLASLLVACGAVALAAPALLDVSEAIAAAGGDPAAGPARAAMREGARLLVLAALVAAAVVAGWGLAEHRGAVGPQGARALHRGGAVLGGALAVAALAGALAADPVDRARSAWSSFQGGYAENTTGGSRLTGGLGSDRADFYRVALRAFAAQPVRGEGTEQFRERYLREGRGAETPRHVHSLPLRVLAQTGLVGAALFLAFAIAALVAAWRRARGPGRAASATAAAGLAMAVSFGVHASADWLFEIAGVGAIALWALGVATATTARPAPAAPPAARTPAAVLGALGGALVLAAALAPPWLAERDVAAAGAAFRTDPARALGRLDRAARIDPVAAGPLLAEGTARLRLGDRDGADRAFAEALERSPDDHYATLMRGAIASAEGRREEAVATLRRARRQAPRDEVAAEALQRAREGRVDLLALQQALLRRAT